MGENSKIEWTDHTFNPWLGCTKVSDGCRNCYAENWADRFGQVGWGPKAERRKTSEVNWAKPHYWNQRAAINGQRQRVFVGSLCDVFEHKPDQAQEMHAWRSELWKMLRKYTWLDWLLLTKRPENILATVPASWVLGAWPSNVWIGTSVEDQDQADKRIPYVLQAPAPVRFLSMEPLLGPVSIFGTIDWVIVGGESGPNRRRFQLSWAEDLLNQCRAVGVPFFFKQIDKVAEIPAHLAIREFPKIGVFNV